MDFPSSSLQDSNEDDNVTTPSVTPTKATLRSLTPPSGSIAYCKRQRQWPSPHMHLKSLSLVKVTTSSLPVTTVCPDQRQPAAFRGEQTSDNSREMMTHGVQETAPGAVEQKPEDTEYRNTKGKTCSEETVVVSDVKSNTETVTTGVSTAGTSVSRPSPSVQSPHDSVWVLESGAESSEDFRGTFWPAGKVIKTTKRSSRSSTGHGPFPGDSEFSLCHVDQTTDSTMAQTGPDPSFEQVSDDKMSEVPTSTLVSETARVSSAAYEADTEADTSGLQTASMGSRAAWAVARADRANRYAALHSEESNVDTSTDEDSEFGVELTTSPSLPGGQEPDGKVIEQVNLPCVEDRAPQNGLEARVSQQTSSATLLEPLEKLNSDMSISSEIDCSASSSQKTIANPIIPIHEYLDNKSLRHKLLDGMEDFILEEKLDKQDPSSPKDQFLVTRQLDLEDPFEAAVASFGSPEWASRQSIDQSDDNAPSDGYYRPSSPRPDPIADSSAPITQDGAYYFPIPFPSVYAHTQQLHRSSGLMKRMRKGLISEQGSKDKNEENSAKATNNRTDISPSLLENKRNTPRINEGLFGRNFGPSPPFETSPPMSTDNWEKPTIRYGAASSLGHAAARGRTTTRDLTSHTAGLSTSSNSSDSSPPRLPRARERGRSSTRRSSSGVVKRRNSRAYGRLPSDVYRKHSRTRSYAPVSKQGNRSSTPSYASSSRKVSSDQTEWLEAHYRKLSDQIALDTARDQPKEPRQRLADVSMVERRQELNRKASIEALCQFIYQCERESEAEEAKENQEEGEEGYTSAMFQG
ncbi:MAG: hypothetical protein Q9216_000696 [Gyalolechia sp. 2 TL-2023]